MAFILIVEDDQTFINALTLKLTGLSNRIQVSVARSRDSAIAQLAGGYFDLIVLDLKIPTVDDRPDADVTHGHAVFAKSQELAPGTAIFVLTGSPAEDFIPALLQRAQQVDVWGEGRRIKTVDFLPKHRFDKFSEMLAPIVEAISSLSDIEFKGEADLSLSQAQDRLIRIFTRRRGGARCAISRVSSGLSGAEVLRLRITDEAGAPRDLAIAKIGTHDQIREETEHFDRHVSRLEPEATPRKLDVLEYGAKNLAGVFYSLAAGFDRSFFDLVKENDVGTSDAVKKVEMLTKKWRDGVGESRVSARDVRRRLLDDITFHQLIVAHGLDWARDLENRQMQVRWCCVHGDLHGLNVLVDADNKCVLIDYGDIADGPASLDPITLEFSVLCHSVGPLVASPWPQADRALQWGDLGNYLQDCPCPNFVRECRAWAKRVAVGDRELAVTACFYLIRQLKYGDTNKKRILNLLAGVKVLVDQTYGQLPASKIPS